MAADFSMKVLDFEPNKKFQSFLSIMFDHSMISIINTDIKKTTIAIDHISINSFTTNKFKTGIIKSNIRIIFQYSLSATIFK